ncbi:hypothetical protein PCK1_002811 [Pneumocystis canis]|nr:hypothetical protein PCK1_002811 [Pneumocystis canis]
MNKNGKKRSYQQQYANIYFLRLVHIRPKIVHKAQEQWGDITIKEWKVKRASRLLDIIHGEICWVVGTVYIDSPLKPNILKDIKKNYSEIIPANEKYIHSMNYHVILEDEYGRIRLIGPKVLQEFLVTGCVIGVLGFEVEHGSFEVIDICLPELPPQISLPNQIDLKTCKYVALASGFNITDQTCHSLPLFLLSEYLNGEIGHSKDRIKSSQIVQFIIAGNSVISSCIDNDLNHRKKTYNPKPIEILDAFLSDISATISVTLMPGESDPSTVLLPQQPIHFSLIPNSLHYSGSTLTTCTNPVWLEIDGIRFFGSMCYPFSEKDPFILSETPHVYFVGNQEKFDTKLIEGENGQKTRLIMLPVFSKTGNIVLLNLSTLECEQMEFNIIDDTICI